MQSRTSSIKYSGKFEEIVHSIQKNIEDDNYVLYALSFINTMILTPDNINDRDTMRKAFMKAGIEKVLKKVREYQVQHKIDKGFLNENVIIQIDVFNEEKELDMQQLVRGSQSNHKIDFK